MGIKGRGEPVRAQPQHDCNAAWLGCHQTSKRWPIPSCGVLSPVHSPQREWMSSTSR